MHLVKMLSARASTSPECFVFVVSVKCFTCLCTIRVLKTSGVWTVLALLVYVLRLLQKCCACDSCLVFIETCVCVFVWQIFCVCVH